MSRLEPLPPGRRSQVIGTLALVALPPEVARPIEAIFSASVLPSATPLPNRFATSAGASDVPVGMTSAKLRSCGRLGVPIVVGSVVIGLASPPGTSPMHACSRASTSGSRRKKTTSRLSGTGKLPSLSCSALSAAGGLAALLI